MRSQRGFSLAEVLVALLVLAIVITTTLAMFVERQKKLRQATEMILAYQSLANEAEIRRRIAFKDLESASGSFITDTSLLQPLAPYATIVSVTTTKPEVKNVMMTVRWNNGQRAATLGLVRVDTGGTNLW